MTEEDRLRVEIIGYKDSIDRLLSQLSEKDKQIEELKIKKKIEEKIFRGIIEKLKDEIAEKDKWIEAIDGVVTLESIVGKRIDDILANDLKLKWEEG